MYVNPLDSEQGRVILWLQIRCCFYAKGKWTHQANRAIRCTTEKMPSRYCCECNSECFVGPTLFNLNLLNSAQSNPTIIDHLLQTQNSVDVCVGQVGKEALPKTTATTTKKTKDRRDLFLQFSSNSLRPHGLQHARLPCPSLSPGVCSNLC